MRRDLVMRCQPSDVSVCFVALLAAAGCASSSSAGWVAGPPELLLTGSAATAAEARIILRDRTELTLMKPRRAGSLIEGLTVAACAGRSCEEVSRSRAVAIERIQWISARFEGRALAEHVAARVEAEGSPAEADGAHGSPPAARRDVGRPVDVVASLGAALPTSGGGYSGGLTIGFEVRVASRMGLGVAAAVHGGGHVDTGLGSSGVAPYMTFLAGDVMAIYRPVMAPSSGSGAGLGFNLGAGFTWMDVRWHPGRGPSCPLISFSCTPPPWTPPTPAFSSGGRAGVVVGVGFDVRWPWIVMGLDARWRAAVSGGDTIQFLTLGLHAGFSFG